MEEYFLLCPTKPPNVLSENLSHLASLLIDLFTCKLYMVTLESSVCGTNFNVNSLQSLPGQTQQCVTTLKCRKMCIYSSLFALPIDAIARCFVTI